VEVSLVPPFASTESSSTEWTQTKLLVAERPKDTNNFDSCVCTGEKGKGALGDLLPGPEQGSRVRRRDVRELYRPSEKELYSKLGQKGDLFAWL